MQAEQPITTQSGFAAVKAKDFDAARVAADLDALLALGAAQLTRTERSDLLSFATRRPDILR